MSNIPPDALWAPTGQHPTGTTVALNVRICRDLTGHIWSYQTPASSADAELLDSWPGKGTRAIAHALLVEALRREAYMCILTAMTRDNDLIIRYLAGDDAAQIAMREELTAACTEMLVTTIPAIVPDTIHEMMTMVALQHRPPTEGE